VPLGLSLLHFSVLDVTVLLQAADVADQQIRSSDVAVDLAYLLLCGTEEYFTLD
jgi:hypothetical protein